MNIEPDSDFLNDLNINNVDGISLRRDPKFNTPNPISSKSKQQFTPMVSKGPNHPNDIGYATGVKGQYDRNAKGNLGSNGALSGNKRFTIA